VLHDERAHAAAAATAAAAAAEAPSVSLHAGGDRQREITSAVNSKSIIGGGAWDKTAHDAAR
jgi:hypothetical protein